MNGSENAWTRARRAVTLGSLLRFPPRLIWLVVCAFVPALPASEEGRAKPASDPAPALADSRWYHPSAIYPGSLRRWFADLPPGLQYSELRVRRGDDPRWAHPEWPDADWAVQGFWDLPAREGVYWVRFRVRMKSGAAVPAGIMISTVRTYQLFWDGVQLGASGRPAEERGAEQAGRVDAWFSVPDALRGPGEHLVALRTSSHRVGFPAAKSGFRFLIDTPAVLQGLALREAFVPTLAAGALCMVALAALILWLLAARRPTLLLLAGVCILGAAMQGLQAARWFFHYPADWHHPVLVAMVALVAAQGVLTVAFVVVFFAVPRRGLLLGGLIAIIALVPLVSPERMNLEGVWMLGAGLLGSLAVAGWAMAQGRRGAGVVATGLLVSAAVLLIESADFRASFFLKFLPALLGMIGALALEIHDGRRKAREALLATARLETELLKKNLQPHFLFNTLAVLTEIVEQDPRAAVRLIEGLADEFRSVARVSAEKLIPLAQELELCRAHLRVMSVRTGRTWEFDAAGVDEAMAVPPAVLLTLIENGFTHQRVTTEPTVFRLAVARARETTRLTFFSPGAVCAEATRPTGGTGLRYVKARLEESFPGRWTLRGEAVAGGWQSTIEVSAGLPSLLA